MKQVDTCSQIKKCMTNLSLSYGASNGRTIGIFVLNKDWARQYLTNVGG